MGNAESEQQGPASQDVGARDIGSPGLVGPSMPPARAVPPEGPDGQRRPEAFGALFSTTRDDIAKIEGPPTAAPKDIPTDGLASSSSRKDAKDMPALGVLGKELQSQNTAPNSAAASPSVSDSGHSAREPKTSSPGKVGAFEATKGSAVLAKRKVRKKPNLLPEWEETVDSDQEREERRFEAEREAGKGYIQFEGGPEEMYKAKEYTNPHGPGPTQQSSEEIDVLKSWEERVLNLKVQQSGGSRKAHSGTGAATTVNAPSSTLLDSVHEVDDAQAEGKADENAINYEELRRFAQEAPACIPVPMDRSWQVLNAEGKWTTGMEEGMLDGTAFPRPYPMVATHMDYNLAHADFDMQAELCIEGDDLITGIRSGIVFRSDGSGNFFAFAVKYNGFKWLASLTQHMRRHRQTNEKPLQLFPSGVNSETEVDIELRTFHVFRVRAVEREMNLFLDGFQLATVKLSEVGHHRSTNKNKSGSSWKSQTHFGVVSGLNKVRVRSMMVADLKDYAESLQSCAKDLDEEKTRLRKFHVERMAYSCRASRASKLIQEVAKFKVELIQQRMRRYKQAEDQRTHTKMREINLMTWLAVLHFAAKFDDIIHEGQELAVIQQQFLKKLEPPPLPPPSAEPPNAAEEELHKRYEAARHKYKKEWERAGRKWMGKAEFKKMRDNFDHSKADKKREEIAKQLQKKAGEVMSEVEHQDNLRRAWILNNDWQTWEDAHPDADAHGSSQSASGHT